MYVKRHAIVKGGKRYVYLRLVEAYRDEQGRVRHRVLRTLGREDELKASGQLEQLAASFARLDPPPAGTRRHVGPLLLVAQYLASGRLRVVLPEWTDEGVPLSIVYPSAGHRSVKVRAFADFAARLLQESSRRAAESLAPG